MKLAAEPGEDAQAQALEAVAVYTQTFNKMGFIETEERDEIYMALREMCIRDRFHRPSPPKIPP